MVMSRQWRLPTTRCRCLMVVMVVSLISTLIMVNAVSPSYTSMTANDCRASSSSYSLLSSSFTLLISQQVLFVSDGSMYPDPKTPPVTTASLWLQINDDATGNHATINWGSSFASQHSYSLVACASLSPGAYTVKLMASSKGVNSSSSLCVAAGANLAVFPSPASSTQCVSLSSDSSAMSFPVLPHQRYQPVAHHPLLEIAFPPCERAVALHDNHTVATTLDIGASSCDIIALAAGSSFQAGSDGASMWGLYMNGVNAGNDESLWTVNDLSSCSELSAPMFTHGLFYPSRTQPTTISLDASAFPVSDQKSSNDVKYAVASSTTLVALRGGFKVYGSYSQSADQDDWWDYVCAGSSHGEANCPPASGKLTDALILADVNFTLPLGHSGEIMFITKSRVAGGEVGDGGGMAWLQLEVDGVLVGSTAVQQLQSATGGVWPMRTLSASYLSATPSGTPLKPGVSHRVRALSSARGDFQHVNNVKDVSLVWFD